MAREAAERNLAPSSNPQVNEKQAQITAQADQQRPQVDSESVNAQFKILTDQLKDVNEQLQGLPEDHPDIEGLQNKAGTIAQQMAALERGEPIELEIPKKEEPEGDERFKPKPTPEEAPPPKQEPSAAEQAPPPVSAAGEAPVAKPTELTKGTQDILELVDSGTDPNSFSHTTLLEAAAHNGIRIPVGANNEQIIDAIKASKPAEAPTEAQPTQPNAVQIKKTGEVGVRNAPAVGEGVGEENKPEVAPEQGEAPKEEVTVPLQKQDKTYLILLKKAKPVGENLYELSERQLTKNQRLSLLSEADKQRKEKGTLIGGGTPLETDAFYLKPKSEVTGDPYDEGWILKDKRPLYIERKKAEAPKEEVKPESKPEEKKPSKKKAKEEPTEEEKRKAEYDKAWNDYYDLSLNPELKKSQVRSVAKKLLAKGFIDERDIQDMELILKDRDMSAEDALDSITPREPKPVEKKAEEVPPEYKDPAKAQKIKNSIREGEMILESGKSVTGRKMNKSELESVKKAVDNSRKKLEELPKVGEEEKPAEVEPTRNLERQANEARDRIDARRREGRQTMGVDPDNLADYAIIAADHIAKGVKTFTEFSKNMLEEFGNAIRPYLNKIWEAGKKAYNAYSTGGGRFTKAGAEAGAIRLPRTLQKKVEKAKETAVFAYKSKPAKEAITVSKDAGENAAGIIAKHAANEINNQINRDFFGKKDRKNARLALPFVVEAEADINELNRMEQTLKASNKADPHWQKVALDAIDFARNNLAKLTPTADRVSKMFIRQAGEENANGIYTPIMKAYFAHYQDLDNSMTFGKPGISGGTGFSKMRVHDTFADSIAAGIDPKSLDGVDILQKRIDSGQKAIAYRTWIDSLKGTIDGNSGKPIVTKIPLVTRPDGTQYPQPPDGYHKEHLAGQNVAVKDGYEGILSALDDPSWFSKNAGGRIAVKAAGAGKGLTLLIDTFHLGRVALNQSVIKAAGLSTMKAPIPSYRKGITLLDHSIPELQRMIANGEIPQKWAAGLLENKRLLDLSVKTGFNIGGIADALHQDWIHNIPGIGTFNKWLFGQFQRGAMAESWLLEFQRYRNAFKGMPEEQVARMVSKDLNTKFGNLGRQGFLKSKTMQDTVRLVWLAPQWNEGLIRSELGAVAQTGKAIYDAATGKRLFAGVLARSAGVMIAAQFGANQIINYITRGTPTWDNPEEGIGAKMSAWVPDVISGGPGFFLNPYSLAMETTHAIMKSYERTGKGMETFTDYLRSKSSTLTRPMWDAITGETFLKKKIKSDEWFNQIVSDVVPVPIIAGALYAAGKQAITGEPGEQYRGQYQKQLMSSFGIKPDSAPTEESRIYTLGSHFKAENKIDDNQAKMESPYHDLNYALSIGNMSNAKDAMQKLLETKTPAQVEKYYTQSYPNMKIFQNKSQQKDFMDFLTDEQRDTYERAKEKRKDISIRARDLLHDLK
jgi:hypothetical protein